MKQKRRTRPQPPTSPCIGMKRVRLSRAALCSGTALQAAALVLLTSPATAQPAPNARPTGGQVAQGQATIGGNGTTTLITQQSQRAVINWSGFNIGSAQTVQFAQPNTQSIALNRVISAQPSQIAGHIIANGQIAIVNQSGVVFFHGATVDTAGLVVSAAGITDQDFMAGRLVFSQAPHPGAAISNAGNITIAQAGLAALVAPQVANSGVITAQLGRVVLGGATTFVLDMNGDGLVALNVTGQVTQVQLGGAKVDALVTNIGTILAPGGTVVLTAQAADGLVQKIISAGGTIATPTVGSQTGRVLVSGIGGDVEIDGTVSATGSATGTTGGQIEVNSDHNVTVASGAVVDASGDSGGGLVAIGTTAAYAATAPTGHALLTAANTTIAAGGRVTANATRLGHGGRVAIVAIGSATLDGAVTARGGAASGNGGTVVVQGRSFATNIDPDVSAAGAPGLVHLINTDNVTVCPVGCTLSYADFFNDTASGKIYSVIDGSLTFKGGGVHATNHSLDFQTIEGNANVAGDILVVSGTGLVAPDIEASAAGNLIILGTLAAATYSNGVFTNPGNLSLTAGTGVTEDGKSSGGAPVQGLLIADTLAIKTDEGDIELDSPTNKIGTLGAVSDAGTLALVDGQSLTVAGGVTATSVTLTTVAGDIKDTGNITASDPFGVILVTAQGGIEFSGTLAAGDFGKNGFIDLDAKGGDVIEDASGVLHVVNLQAGASGNVSLTGANDIKVLNSGTAGGDFALDDTSVAGLDVAGDVTAMDVTLSSDAGGMIVTGNITANKSSGAILLTAQGDIEFSGTLAAGDFVQNGFVDLDAKDGDVIEDTSGVLHVLNLQADASGNVSLTSTNTVAVLNSGSAGGNFVLDDSLAAGLEVVGNITVSDPSGVISLTSQGGIDFSGVLAAGDFTNNGTIVLDAKGGDIVEGASGVLHVLNLQADASGNVLLTSVHNDVAVLDSGSAGSNFEFNDSVAAGLAVTGLVEAGTTVAASTLLLQAPSITMPQSSVPGAAALQSNNGTIALAANTFVLGGTINAGKGVAAFDVYAKGGVLTLVANGGNFGANGFGDLTAGTLVLGSTTATAAGNTSSLQIEQALSAAPALGLFSTGDVTEDPGNGVIKATSLFGTADTISLTSATNAIGTLGLVSATAINIVDSTQLRLAGDINAGSAEKAGTLTLNVHGNLVENAGVLATALDGGTLSLMAAAGDIALLGNISAGTVLFSAGRGSISEAAGVGKAETGIITADSLAGTASGAIDLAGANSIGAIAPGTLPDGKVVGGLDAGGTLTLVDGRSLDITDTTSLGYATVSGNSAQAIGVTIDLTSGVLTQGGGTISTASGGTISLAALNGIMIGGAVQAGIETAGVYDGSLILSAGTLTTLASITETTGGTLLAATLSANATGDVSLNSTKVTGGGTILLNQIAALGASASGGNFIFTDADSLTVDGDVSAGSLGTLGHTELLLGSSGGTLTLAKGNTLASGSLTTLGGTPTLVRGTIALQADNFVLNGTIDAGTGEVAADRYTTGTLMFGADVHDLDITAGTLVLGSITGDIGNTNDLIIDSILPAGVTTLGLFSAGDINDTNALNVANLFGAAHGDITLSSNHNSISTIVAAGTTPGLSSKTGTLTLVDTGQTLRLAANASLTAASDVTITAATLIQGTSSVIRSTGGAVTIDAASFTQDAGSSLTELTALTGVAILGEAQQDGNDLITATGGSVGIGGGLQQTGSAVNASGNVTVGGSVGQSSSSVSAGGSVVVTGAGVTQTLTSNITGTNGVYLLLGDSLTQDSSSTITAGGSATMNAVLVIDAGGHIQALGTLQAGTLLAGGTLVAGTLALRADTGDIDATGTVLLASGTLAAQATHGGIDITGVHNVIGAIDALSIAEPGGATLQLDGLVAANSLDLQDSVSLVLGRDGHGATLSAADVTIDLRDSGGGAFGTLTQTDGTITATTGDIVVVAGQFDQAGGIATTASGNITFTANVTQTGDSAGTGGTISATSGSVTITGSASQTASLIHADDAVTIDGSAGQSGSTISAGGDVTIGGSATQVASVITAGTDVGIGASVTQTSSAITAGGSVTVTGATVSQSDASTIAGANGLYLLLTGDFTQDATSAVAAGNDSLLLIDTTGGNVNFAGTLQAGTLGTAGAYSGTLALVASENILGSGSSIILAGTLAGSAGSAISLTGTENVISNVDAITVPNGPARGGVALTGLIASTGTLDLNDSVSLSLGTASTGTTLSGTSVTVDVAGTNTLTQSGGLITATSSGGAILLAAGLFDQIGGKAETASGAIQITADVTQSEAALIVANGGPSIGNVLITGSAAQDASTIQAAGDVTIIGSTVAQTDASAITGTNGVYLLLADGFTQNDAGSAVTAGNDKDSINPLLVIESAAGDIDFAGTLQAGRLLAGTYTGTLALAAENGSLNGGVNGTVGTLLAGTLAGSAQGTISLQGPLNVVSAIDALTFVNAGLQGTPFAGTLNLGGIAAGGALIFLDSASGLAIGNSQAGATVQGSSVTLALQQSGADIGTITQIGGTITATTGDILLQSSAVTQTSFGRIEASIGNVAIDGSLVQASGTVTATSISITGATIQTDHSLLQSVGNATLLGGLSQTMGTLIAGGSLTLTGPALVQTTQSAINVAGGLFATLANGLSQDASSVIASGGAPIEIIATGGNIDVEGAVTTTGRMALVAEAGSIDSTGTIVAGTLAGTASGSLALNGGTNQIAEIAAETLAQTGATLTGLTAGIALSLNDATSLLLNNATLRGANIDLAVTNGGLTQAAGLMAATGTLGITATGDLTQTDEAAISAADAIIIRLGGDYLAQSPGTSIVSSVGNIDFAARSFTVGGLLQATAGSITLTDAGGGFTEDTSGNIEAANGISLTLTGAFFQAEDTAILHSTSGNVTISASVFDQGGQIVADAGAIGLTSTSTFTQETGSTIDAGDSVTVHLTTGNFTQAQGATITAGSLVTISAENLDQSGMVSATAGTIGLFATNDFTQETGGDIVAGPDGSDAGLIAVQGSGTMSFAGTLQAGTITLGVAPTKTTPGDSAKSVIWNDGTVIYTGSSLTGPSGRRGLDVKTLPTFGKQPGVFVYADNFIQNGLASVRPLGTAQAMIDITLAGPGGNIMFGPPGSGLFAPDGQLILDLQKSGTTEGNIDVAGLNIFYLGTVPPPNGFAHLTGEVAGLTGFAAAGVGYTHALPGVDYTFNSCPIQSVNCVLLSPILIPVNNPVEVEQATVLHRRDDDDDDLILPNVAEQDY